ncbi:glycosyltransferase [uncultured Bacteroides sp.]|uniref:glycosyltransferase family 4 protein n=1 Tax=uncultured Bacteroides sp. TaxID=162156 RepID=UPI002AAC2A3B|nr:glycosyltransferase [uncultured Bacteroides sp.]
MIAPKIKIVLINHSFQKEYYYRRWQLFAKSHPNVEVFLLTPTKNDWYATKEYTFSGAETVYGKVIDDDNFHIKLFRLNIFGWSWFSTDYRKLFKEIQPDIIYHIGTHRMLSLTQVAFVAKCVCPKAKLALFSMRGPASNLTLDKSKCSPKEWIVRRLRYAQMKLTWMYVCKNFKSIFCHYPDAVDCFRQEGFKGDLYMQTQVGVNIEWFHEDAEARKEIRAKYNISDNTYVFGSASRFTKDKGIDVILRALPQDGDWMYFMIGTGSEDDLERLRSIIRERHLEDKVIETGFVDWFEMAKYWNAVDCAIHVPLTTSFWVETFSLAVVQPMITKKPIIGDDSGSVPYQIGFPNMIVPENDVEALADKINCVLANKEEASRIGLDMYERTYKSFTVQHLNDMFYDTLLDILSGTYNEDKFDMTKYTPKNNEG